MKITYTGRQVELAPAELKKLEARFAKIGVLLDGKKECEVHVVLSLERGAQLVEAVRYGVARGTAAVTAAGHTLCSGHDVEALLPDVVVSPAALADQTRLSSPR